MLNKDLSKKLCFEQLESRVVLSLIFGVSDDLDSADGHKPNHPNKPGGGDPEPEPAGPEIDLYTVALHEFGHSLGLGHSSGSDGITAVMDPFYSGAVSGLAAQDISRIQALYPETGDSSGGTAWLSTAISYSFMPDGSSTETVYGKGKPRAGSSSLTSTMNAAFGSEAVWKQIFADALEDWAAASRADGLHTQLVFTEVADAGLNFNYTGLSQGDPHSGDIRVGTHRFDGAGGTIAHAYFPPPNGSTAAGDAHFDEAENWVDQSASASSTLQSGTSTSPGRSGKMTLSTGAYSELEETDDDSLLESEESLDLLIENSVTSSTSLDEGQTLLDSDDDSTDLSFGSDDVDAVFNEWPEAENTLTESLAVVLDALL